MSLTHDELAERLREAREACGLTQEAVASQLGVSRPTIAQIEAGNRKVTGLELVHLARLYGRAITDFLNDEFDPTGEPVMLRALPEARTDTLVRAAVNEAVALVREIAQLRDLLGSGRGNPGLPLYRPARPATRWDTIGQGTRLADLERQRLGLGIAPVPDLAALMELQGATVLEMELPPAVSGFTLRSANGAVLAVQSGEPEARYRFSLAHEYCHALYDWDPEVATGKGENAVVSRFSEAEALEEVRANSFAAAFLLPEDGARRFLSSLGKGSPSRPAETVFAEGQPDPYPTVEGRLPPHSQDVGAIEVGLLADYFKVSRQSAVWRLFNLKLLGTDQRDRLLALAPGEAEWLEEPRAPATAADHPKGRRPRANGVQPLRRARRMLLSLAIEALKREAISTGRFRELAEQAGLEKRAVSAAIAEIESGR